MKRYLTFATIFSSKTFWLTCLLMCLAAIAFVQRLATTTAQAALVTTGSYPNKTIGLSGNISVAPAVAPTNTAQMTVSTTSNFKGILTGDPTTGVVRVTNAHPAGTYTINVKNFDNDSSSGTAAFTLTVETQACNATPSFNFAPDASTGSRASSLAVGDFNGDGKQDFAAVSFDTYTVSTRLGNGSGGFSGSSDYDLGELLPAVVTGDFNGDGKADLAVTRYQSSEVSVLNGDGAGNFSNGSSVNVGERPTTLVTADFNGDGKLDIAVTNILLQTVNIRFGDGLGGFSGATSFAVGNTPNDIRAGDFNGDGKPDLAVTCSGTNIVFIRLNNGAGGFTNAPDVAVQAPGPLAVGDFNADGKADLAVANTRTGLEGVPTYVAIRLGTGTGTFTNAANINNPLNIYTYAIAVADFNGDGKEDLGINRAGFGSNPYTTIQLGNGTGGFTPALNVGLDGSRTPDSIVMGDFNGDGAQDFAVGSRNGSGVQIRLAPSCVPPNTPPTITPSSLAAAKGDQGNVVPLMLATVNDAETPAGNLSVNVIPGGTATGITIDSILNNGGDVRAFFLVACNATPGTIKLQVTDEGGLTATGDYQVFLSENSAPTLGTYPATTLEVGASTTVTPSDVPFDSGVTPTITVVASAGFTGSLTVNGSSGIVTINNAAPVGTHTITVRASDNCGAMTSKSFSLLVNAPNPCSTDTIKPTINTFLGVSSLWPANSNLLNVGFSFTTQDNCTPTSALSSQVQVFANVDDQTPTVDGTFSPDAKGIGTSVLRLRAERRADGTGRVYLIVVKTTDSTGNLGINCATVVVPQSQSAANVNAVNVAAASAKAYCLANGGMPPAGYFVMGDGPIIGTKQ
jgi:hypothetical protein